MKPMNFSKESHYLQYPHFSISGCHFLFLMYVSVLYYFLLLSP